MSDTRLEPENDGRKKPERKERLEQIQVLRWLLAGVVGHYSVKFGFYLVEVATSEKFNAQGVLIFLLACIVVASGCFGAFWVSGIRWERTKGDGLPEVRLAFGFLMFVTLLVFAVVFWMMRARQGV